MNERPYHHGSLRSALLQAGSTQLERSGFEALSLRDLAASLEVSRAAPYRHFGDRRALLAGLAADGFKQLEQLASAAIARESAPSARLILGARAYLAFALRHPELFRLMFVSDLLTRQAPRDPQLVRVANSFHLKFEALIAENCRSRDEKTIKAAALTFWSVLHGFALLRMGKRLMPFMLGPLSEAQLREAVLNAAAEIPASVRRTRHVRAVRGLQAGANRGSCEGQGGDCEKKTLNRWAAGLPGASNRHGLRFAGNRRSLDGTELLVPLFRLGY